MVTIDSEGKFEFRGLPARACSQSTPVFAATIRPTGSQKCSSTAISIILCFACCRERAGRNYRDIRPDRER